MFSNRAFVFAFAFAAANSFELGSKGAVPLWAKNELFTGGLLGVSAEVLLCRHLNCAIVSLSGVPLGGRVSGVARLGTADSDKLIVEEPLKGVLARRLVKLVNATHDELSDQVSVIVDLPFFGKQTILLTRSFKREIKDTCF